MRNRDRRLKTALAICAPICVLLLIGAVCSLSLLVCHDRGAGCHSVSDPKDKRKSQARFDTETAQRDGRAAAGHNAAANGETGTSSAVGSLSCR